MLTTLPQPATWTARAIYHDGRPFELLPDRQDTTGGTDADRAALAWWLDNGVLDVARRVVARRCVGDQAEAIEVYRDAFTVITANTNGSYGYVYLTATVHGPGSFPWINDPRSPNLTVWSADTIPAVGDTIQVTSASWASKDGRAVVLGYFVEHGYGFVVCRLTKPTAERKRQHKERLARKGKEYVGAPDVWNVMGREWAPITPASAP